MERSQLPVNVDRLRRWWSDDRHTLRCDLPFQRHSGAWTPFAKSSLIWSMLSDGYIPPVLLLKDRDGTDEKGKEVFTYNIEDGQQRLTTVFGYMNDEWACHGATPPVELDGFIYDLAGLKFSALPEELQNIISQYRFNIQCLEGYTMDEAETLFFNINNGVPLSQIQKAKSRMGTDLIRFFSGLLEGNFFTQAVNVTEAQARREDDLLMLIQGTVLLDNMLNGYEYRSISAANCLSYASYIRGAFKENVRDAVSESVAYLDRAFKTGCKFLKKNNVPIVIVIAHVASQTGVSEEDFRMFINAFSNAIYPSYDAASGSGNVKAKSVQMRLRVMYLAFCVNFGLDALEAGIPFASDVPLYEGLCEEDGLLPDEGISAAESSEVDEDSSRAVGFSGDPEVSDDETDQMAEEVVADERDDTGI